MTPLLACIHVYHALALSDDRDQRDCREVKFASRQRANFKIVATAVAIAQKIESMDDAPYSSLDEETIKKDAAPETLDFEVIENAVFDEVTTSD